MTLREAVAVAVQHPEQRPDPMLTLVRRWQRDAAPQFARLARILGHSPVAQTGRAVTGIYGQTKGPRIRSILVMLALAAMPVQAQTTTGMLIWDVENQTPATVNTYTRTVAVDGVVISAAPTCVVATAPKIGTTCSVPVTGLQTGTHAATVTYVLGSTTVSTTKSALSLTPGPQPGQPVNIRIELLITVTVP